MNLNVLASNVMLAQSWRWLSTDAIREAIMAHPVGAALLPAVEAAHERLADQSERRRQLELALQRLTALIAQLDGVHDGKARAIHGVLVAAPHGTDDPEFAAACRETLQILFPEGLDIVRRSYIYEAGAIEALERRVTPALVDWLAGIRIGEATLADWYRDWVEAGRALGRHVQDRAHLLKSTGRGGTGATDVDSQAARRQWIGTVRTFLSALPLMQLDDDTRERIVSGLEASVTNALRGRPGAAPGDVAGDEPGDEPGLDDGAGDGADIDGADVMAPAPVLDLPDAGAPVAGIDPAVAADDAAAPALSPDPA